MRSLCFLVLILASGQLAAEESPWYTQGKFEPVERLEFTIVNTLDIDRENAPVVIRREEFPLPDIHEMWITVVDPSLPAYEGPDSEVLSNY